MPQVQVIQPIQQQPKRLRVAAYARVSSDSEDQLNSLAVQVDYYTHLIQENPNWEFAGIYTDEGITGTSTKRREQFNRLMDDCRAGLIDRVLVKSASRFARNTADALSSVRELKSLGVTVAFEKEGFDTETSNGEMLLSIICAVAQEESLSISQNMKWGIHKRMRTGNYITNATPFGYTQINHQLVPEKNNAMIVNDIFKSYLSGMSINEIAEHLNTIYPKENKELANMIINQGGTIISEYPLGTTPERMNFPARNRIVSGLSTGTLVIEAKEKSGTLITVDFALEQGKEVFVVPGNINSINSVGTNRLIKEGAKLVTCYEEIIEEGCY